MHVALEHGQRQSNRRRLAGSGSDTAKGSFQSAIQLALPESFSRLALGIAGLLDAPGRELLIFMRRFHGVHCCEYQASAAALHCPVAAPKSP